MDQRQRRVSLEFDRGTILVTGDRVERLPGVRWDPRVSRYRAPAFRYHELTTAAFPADDHLAATLGKPVAIGMPGLRAYQAVALTSWQAAGNRGVVVLPTGSGKTLLGLGAIAKVGGSALVLVPTRVLLGHWVEALSSHTGQPVGVLGDGSQTVAPVTVCTFESAAQQMDRLGHLFRLLVVDEVHHIGGRLRPEALEMSAAPARIGLTATPPTGPAAQRMEQLVGPVVSQHTVDDLTGGYLAPYVRIPIQVALSTEERERYERAYSDYTAACRRFSRLGGAAPGAGRLFDRIASASVPGRKGLVGLQRARRVLSLAAAKLRLTAELLDRHRRELTLVFTADAASAHATSRALLIPAITCDIRRREREAVIARLKCGRYRAVVSAQVLNEGFDLPSCRVGVVLGASSNAERESKQRLGRLLRAAPGKTAVLYQLMAERTFEVEHDERKTR